VIFRLRIIRGARDPGRGEIGAQARQRPLVEKSRQIVGGIGQELAAAETDEQIEIFAFGLRRDGIGGGRGQLSMRAPERRRITDQCGQLIEQPS
jgi:hypothetical protein